MIPLPGATPALTGANEALRASKQSAQPNENNGFFGDVLSTETALLSTGSANGAALEAGGNALPADGNTLPALPGADGVAPGTADSPDLDQGEQLKVQAEGAQTAIETVAEPVSATVGPVAAAQDESVASAASSIRSEQRPTAPAAATPATQLPETEAPPVTALDPSSREGVERAGQSLTEARPTSAPAAGPVGASSAPAGQTAITASSPVIDAPEALTDAEALIEPRTPQPGRLGDNGANTPPTAASLVTNRREGVVDGPSGPVVTPATRDLPQQQPGSQRLTVAESVTLEPQASVASVDKAAAGPTASAASSAVLPGFTPPGQLDAATGVKPTTLAPLTTPPGEPEFTGELAGRVNIMLKQGSQEASLQLNPPELGRLDIRIVTEGDQARVQFAVHNPEAREMIEQNLPRLREMLEQGGLQLARSDVADQSQGRRPGHAPGTELPVPVEEDTDTTALPQQLHEGAGVSQSRVDYYV